MKVRWNDLGDVAEPGEYTVPGVGVIQVAQRDIELVAQSGGNPQFTLYDVTAAGDRMKHYRLGLLVP